MKLKKTSAIILFLTFLISTAFSAANMVEAPDEGTLNIKSDCLLMTSQCILGMIMTSLPYILKKRFLLDIPNKIVILYFIFLFSAIYLGEVHQFYYKIPYWDSVLHGFSSIMLGFTAFFTARFFNTSKGFASNLDPLLIAVFAFCFSLSAETLWEIYEFISDSVLGLNMQRYRLADGTELIGRSALADTMKDIMIDAAGALAVSTAGYFFLKNKK